MKVSELIEDLKEMNPESEVIIQKDSEGNGYSPCAGADGEAVYVPESGWYGTVYDTSWTAEDSCMDEEEWEEVKKTATPAVIIFPVN